MSVAVILVESPDDPALGGPRILGRTAKPELVAAVREQLATDRREELERLQGHGRVFRVFQGGEDAGDTEDSE